jgi:Na+/proline symporter
MRFFDYAILALYFLTVILIGLRTRKSVHTSDDFFLSSRSLPAWITGLAFMAANLGSFELMGFAANGAKYGMFSNQLCWIGSVPAMIFSGLVMVRIFYGSKVRSVPEFLRLRFDEKCRGLNAISFAFLTILTSPLFSMRCFIGQSTYASGSPEQLCCSMFSPAVCELRSIRKFCSSFSWSSASCRCR